MDALSDFLPNICVPMTRKAMATRVRDAMDRSVKGSRFSSSNTPALAHTKPNFEASSEHVCDEHGFCQMFSVSVQITKCCVQKRLSMQPCTWFSGSRQMEMLELGAELATLERHYAVALIFIFGEHSDKDVCSPARKRHVSGKKITVSCGR